MPRHVGIVCRYARFYENVETMQPEAVADITFNYLLEITDVIHKHGGTVDKYMGDAVMAFGVRR